MREKNENKTDILDIFPSPLKNLDYVIDINNNTYLL